MGRKGAVRLEVVVVAKQSSVNERRSGDLLGDDGGRTWQTLTMAGLPTELRQASPVAIGPQRHHAVPRPQPHRSQGLWVSHDDATTGSYVSTGLAPGGSTVVTVDGARLVALGGQGTTNQALQAVGNDGGTHWTTQPAAGLPPVEIGGSTLAIAEDHEVLDGGDFGGFTSNNGGRTWTRLANPGLGIVCPATGGPGLIGGICNYRPTEMLLTTGNSHTDTIQFATQPSDAPNAPGEGGDGSTYFAIGNPSHLWLTDGHTLWESTGQPTTWHPVDVPWSLAG